MPRPLHKRINFPSALTPGQRNDLYILLERTNTEVPEESDVRELHAYFQRYPELWDQVGSLVLTVRDQIITNTTLLPVVRQAMHHVADAMRRSLTLPTDSAIEKLLIEHCVTAHLLHYTLLSEYTAAEPGTLAPEDIAFWERRLTVSENRFLRTVETLARVRNLAFPLMQINIATQQTNISTPASDDLPTPTRLLDQPPPPTARKKLLRAHGSK